MADADENSSSDPARTGASSESASEETSREDTSKRLPSGPEGSVPADGQPKNQDGVPVDDSFAEEAFAEDVSGAEDFSEKALSKRTRKAYRRAWSDFLKYCERIGKDPLPARPLAVAAYINNRARARPTGPARARRIEAPLGSAPARASRPRP